MGSVEVNQTFYFYKGKKKIKSKPVCLEPNFPKKAN